MSLDLTPEDTVIIISYSMATAGSDFNITCTAHTVERLVTPPILIWNSTNVGGTITFGRESRLQLHSDSRDASAGRVISKLEFLPLFTTDAATYHCIALYSAAPQADNFNATILRVNSELADIWFKLLSFLLSFSATPPDLNVTLSPSLPLYEGVRYNLTCLVSLPTAVDVEINVEGSWIAPSGSQVMNTNRVTVLPITALGSTYLYRSVLMFDPVDSSDKGNYTCSVSVDSRNPSLYGGSSNTAVFSLDVLSKLRVHTHHYTE